MKNKEKNFPKQAEQAMVTDQDLKAKAGELFQVLLAVRETNPEATSELLWKNAKQRWTVEELRTAFEEFQSIGSVERFHPPLFRPLPRARKDGFFICEGEEWGTEKVLAGKWGLSKSTIRKRASSSRRMIAQDSIGRVRVFLLVSDVLRACEDLLRNLPHAGPDGFMNLGRVEYGTLKAHARRIRRQHSTVASRVSSLAYVQGKDGSGRVARFYATEEVLRVCQDLAETLPKAAKDGFVKTCGTLWGTIAACSRRLKRDPKTLKKQVQHLVARPGIDAQGHAVSLYNLRVVERTCKTVVKG